MQDIGRILEYLSQGDYVSGEDLAGELGITRAAVWKQIKGLREMGYEIEAHPRKGYLLANRPDRLYPWEVAKGLSTRFIGKRIEYYDSLSSTNGRAKEILTEAPAEGSIIIAEEQTGGKGRLGRSWFSPPGTGIWLSVILKPQLPPVELPKLTLVAAVALSKAIQEELNRRPPVKWPNDLYLEGRKISGILTELSGEMGRVEYLILGVGINVNQEICDFPAELREKAASLRIITGKGVDRLSLLQAYLRFFESEYLNALKNGFSEVLQYCRDYSATLGRQVEVTDGKKVYRGTAVEIEDTGGLVLENERGERIRVLSGDVNLLPYGSGIF